MLLENLDNIDNLFELWNNYFTICDEPTKGDKEEFLNYVEIGGQIASKLIGKDDVCLLRPSGAAGNTIEIFSSGATELAKIDILYGLEA